MKQNYSELLKDPRWQKKRLEIFNRDNFTCQHCGRTDKSLQVHHLHYEKDKNPWDYDNDSLITLCERCHQSETDANKNMYLSFKELFESWKKSGLSLAALECLLNDLSWYVSKADGDIEEFENSYKFCDSRSIIENSIYATQCFSDCVAAYPLHIDCTSLVDDIYHDRLEEFNQKIKRNGK